jgi:hypothetical protein
LQRVETVLNNLHGVRKNIICYFVYVVGHGVNGNEYAVYTFNLWTFYQAHILSYLLLPVKLNF